MDLARKTAFVTGGGHGIGAALCGAFAQRSMAVVVADIDGEAARTVAESINAQGGRAIGLECDVGRRESVENAAWESLRIYQSVHVVCNNAGVAVTGAIGSLSPEDWNWIFDVNVKGVIHGVETFVPLIRSHGEGGFILNTASVGGFLSGPLAEPYAATKHAIVALTEGWRAQLQPDGIGVALLCPHFVKTTIANSEDRRSDRYGRRKETDDERAALARRGIETGLDPSIVAERAIEGLMAGETYIFTHPTAREPLTAYFANILSALDAADRSQILSKIDVWPPMFRPNLKARPAAGFAARTIWVNSSANDCGSAPLR